MADGERKGSRKGSGLFVSFRRPINETWLPFPGSPPILLFSGGRHMTVVAIRERSDGVVIECVWFETQGMGGEAKTRDCFLPAALAKVEK